MHAPDIGKTRRLSTWLDALDELHAEARRLADAPGDPTTSIAVLHALEQRAHEAFAEYCAYVLDR